MEENLLKTCLYDRHIALGAQMSPFAGYDMPIQYTSIIDEHNAVRNAAGMFDVSHMGEIFVSGPDAEKYVNYVFSNDIFWYTRSLSRTVICLLSMPPISPRISGGCWQMLKGLMSRSGMSPMYGDRSPCRGRVPKNSLSARFTWMRLPPCPSTATVRCSGKADGS